MSIRVHFRNAQAASVQGESARWAIVHSHSTSSSATVTRSVLEVLKGEEVVGVFLKSEIVGWSKVD